MKSTSTSCTSGGCSKASICCKDTIVPITDADVRRLMRATGLAADQIVRLWSTDELEYDRDDTWIKFPYGKRVMGLKKSGNQCKFLNEFGLCTVYQARPLTCRSYPYMVHFDARGRIEVMALNRDVDCCGRLGRNWPKKQLIVDGQAEDREDAAYMAKLRAFEKAGAKGGKAGLIRFLGLE